MDTQRYKSINIYRRGRILYLTIARPEVLNAVDAAFLLSN